MIPVEQIVFYLFACITLLAGTLVITTRHPVRAVLSLVVAFFSSSVLWLLLEAEFLAVTLVLVYVGAVMVLFLFVVMMLDINLVKLREGFARYLPLGVLAAFAAIYAMMHFVGPEHFGLDIVTAPARHTADYSNVHELGRLLYTDYVYPFELAAIILLVAIIAAISLTFRGKQDRRGQHPSAQVKATKAERLTLVKMDAVTEKTQE